MIGANPGRCSLGGVLDMMLKLVRKVLDNRGRVNRQSAQIWFGGDARQQCTITAVATPQRALAVTATERGRCSGEPVSRIQCKLIAYPRLDDSRRLHLPLDRIPTPSCLARPWAPCVNGLSSPALPLSFRLLGLVPFLPLPSSSSSAALFMLSFSSASRDACSLSLSSSIAAFRLLDSSRMPASYAWLLVSASWLKILRSLARVSRCFGSGMPPPPPCLSSISS